eukprot:3937792-Rhodomonas_salina.1
MLDDTVDVTLEIGHVPQTVNRRERLLKYLTDHTVILKIVRNMMRWKNAPDLLYPLHLPKDILVTDFMLNNTK